MPKTFHIWTIGCQYNEWDSTRYRHLFEKIGLKEEQPDKSDIILILACAVRQTAVDRILGRLKNWPQKTIVIVGCVLDSDRKKLEEKGAIIQDKNTKKLAKIIKTDELFIQNELKKANSKSAYLPIMTGCNNFCSYCAVPYTRGREKSKPLNQILTEFKNIINSGHKEIILLGQNVNSYKSKDKKGKNMDFADLLFVLNEIKGDFSISFYSSHPKDMSDKIINSVSNLKKIKKEIHLPLQSGSNKILKSMNRPYTKEKYLEIIEKIKKNNSEIKISTDIIVGFPGETEKDFEETQNIFKKINFRQVFINKYSPRFGTAAYKFGDPISLKTKQERWKIINEMVNKKINK